MHIKVPPSVSAHISTINFPSALFDCHIIDAVDCFYLHKEWSVSVEAIVVSYRFKHGKTESIITLSDIPVVQE